MSKVTNKRTLLKLVIAVHSSLCFLPALSILAFILLALGLIEADKRFGPNLLRLWPQLLFIEADDARSMLSTVASSMATITGVAFSITIVALVLASAQYTSRVLRTFMRDRVTQLVLGFLLACISIA